jgi:hypothetical protein
MTALLITALVVASALALLKWGIRPGGSPRDQVDAFTRARRMTNTWAADPGTTPAPLQEYLADQKRRHEEEPDAG